MMKLASLVLLFSLAFISSSAHAQILDASLDVTGDATTSDVDTSVSTDTTIDVAATSSEETSLNLALENGFSILRSNLDEGPNYAETSAGSVRSSASMEAYAATIVRADERLDAIAMSEDGMTMTYRKPARFLWIFPASLKAEIAVANDGQVSVQYPWYAFLMSTDETRVYLETEIRNEVETIDTALQTSLAAEASGTASTGIQGDPSIRRWARIIEAAYIAASGDARVDASAQASS